MHGDSWWSMGWMGVWWILPVFGIVVGAWYALTSMRQGGSRESPKNTLKRRYANGEIDQESYERMLADLRK